MVVIGCIDNFVRVIAADISVWQFHALRSAMALPPTALMAPAGLRLRPLRPGRVAVRSAAQAASMLLYFGSLASCQLPRSAPGSSPRRCSC